MTSAVRAFAPGRVNLIGDHTDHTGGLVCPVAVDLGTTVEGRAEGAQVILGSDFDDQPAVVDLAVEDPALLTPPWARYVGGVVAELAPSTGFRGHVTTTLPVGAGLSSSAALEVAVALALGFDGTPLELAELCQRAEQRATGVPCGIMDQLASAAGVAGHALVIDCHTLDVVPVPVPPGAEIVAMHSGVARAVAGTAYAERVEQCRAAEARIGPLRSATGADVEGIDDPALRRIARHVVSENARVRAFSAALADGDLGAAGALMDESHRSLRDDFAVSTPALDGLVDRLRATDGVYGARLTGAGFGGCAVALTRPGALREGWVLRPSAGAGVEQLPA